jgi:hypothetical protein
MKTAVEFLIDEIIKLTGVNIQIDEPIIEQAKQMERKQIIYAHFDGCEIGEMYNNENVAFITYSEKYYNETFKKQ